MQARKSRGEWSSIIKAFERSGMSHEEFCAERGLNVGTFRVWLYRLRREVSASSTAIALLPVEVKSPEEARPPSEMVVEVAGVEVRVAIGTDVAYVAGLVAELRARC